jgi:hypothetical protein
MTFQELIAWSILSSPLMFVAWLFYKSSRRTKVEIMAAIGAIVCFIALVTLITKIICWCLNVVAPGQFNI